MWGRREKGNKYGRKRIEASPGHWFDSKLEKALYDLLSLRERGGEIGSLSHQPGGIALSAAKIIYRPDFRFTCKKTGETQYAEAKGYPTREWAIKKRLWKSYGPGVLFVYGGSASHLKLMETITPMGEA